MLQSLAGGQQTVSTGGMWTPEERTAHINHLELKAVLLALQTFASARQNLHILLLVDNSSAIAYLNQKGGIHFKVLSDLAIQIWEWCLTRGITIHAEHIPGVCNTVADAESRGSIEPSDWKLDDKVFCKLQDVWGPFGVDLFAARHNRQLPRYFSFRPDPEAEAVDALSQCWVNMRPYAFPPFILIGRCLRKTEQDQVMELVLIVPEWQNQTWFPNLLDKLIDLPILLPNIRKNVTNPMGETQPLVERSSLPLAACKVSGLASKITDESFKITSAAWRKSTEKSYSSAWGKWMLWCNRTNTDPFPPSVGPVLREQFQEGKQHTTLNSYRSALSATLQAIDGKPIGQHPIVCRLVQGMFNQRPPARRYQEVWDVSLVVRHIRSGPPTAELVLKELSKRLVILLALCNASRASDFRALDTRFKQPIGGGIKFIIPGSTKTYCLGPPREVFFAVFDKADALWTVRTLEIYEERTACLRDNRTCIIK
jgi:hypothetical protein